MKMMARVIKAFKFNDGTSFTKVIHDWAEVKEWQKRFPSGVRECVLFKADGCIYKVEECEVCYVF